jgi:hypothetical protein
VEEWVKQEDRIQKTPVEYERQMHSTGQAGDRISKPEYWNFGMMENT